MTTKNQSTPPHKKKVDAQGNKRYRLFYKSGNATMLFCAGITKPAAEYLSKRIATILNTLGTKLEGTFIITQ